MFHRAILIGVICTLSALQAQGSTAYTSAGDAYKGKVTKRGKKVIIETASGRVELNAKDVIHIEYTDDSKPKVVTQPATTQPAAGDPVAIPSELLKSGAMVLGAATRPEPIIYVNMRAEPFARNGADLSRIRRQIGLWRAHAHDRLRKAGKRWLTPKDFVRHRAKYAELLKEADRLRTLSRGSRRYSSSKTAPVLTPKQKRYKYEAFDKMYQAARSWADPSMQNFLVGIAQMQAQKFDRAETAFKLGAKQAPLLAGMHQGVGLACAKQFRYLAALESFLEVLKLKPDSSEAVYLVRETMKLVPGRSIKSALYRKAVEALIPYTEPPRTKSSSSYRTQYVEWLMPGGGNRGKDWRVAETTMPTPPYDRLEYRQAVGVPLAKHTLVVDSKVVEGALEVFVRIDGVLVPARVGRSTYSRSQGRPPVTTVYLVDYEMTPVSLPTKEKPAKAGKGEIHAVGIFGQLNQTVRQIPCEFTPGGEKKPGSITKKLFPGDATSPVISESGMLVGFVAGKTTVAIKGAGPDKFISIDEISNTVRRAASSRNAPSRSGYNSAKREITPKPIAGKIFVIYSILGEAFKAGV
jgi:tetratricopeptide (TPR) repeat protein